MCSLFSTLTRDMATCSSTLNSTHSISSSSQSIYRRLKLNHGYKHLTISGLDELTPTPYRFFFIIVINYIAVLEVKDVNIIDCVINIRPTDTAGIISFHLLQVVKTCLEERFGGQDLNPKKMNRCMDKTLQFIMTGATNGLVGVREDVWAAMRLSVILYASYWPGSLSIIPRLPDCGILP